MSLRTFLALVAVCGLIWAWNTGRIWWLVGILIAYVIWMWLRIPLERSQRRARMPSFTDIKPWKDQR